MSVIFLLIGFSLIIALVFLGAFMWATRSGQYDDDYTPAVRMTFDDTVSPRNDNQPEITQHGAEWSDKSPNNLLEQ